MRQGYTNEGPLRAALRKNPFTAENQRQVDGTYLPSIVPTLQVN